MLKDSVIALLQAEKDKKVSEVTQTVSAEFDGLVASVQALPDDASGDVAALQAQIADLQSQLTTAQAALADLQKKEGDEAAALAVDESKIEKIKEELAN